MVRVNYPFGFKILPRFLTFVNREFDGVERRGARAAKIVPRGYRAINIMLDVMWVTCQVAKNQVQCGQYSPRRHSFSDSPFQTWRPLRYPTPEPAGH